MKILRSVTRRGFNVGTAGWFTVTAPARWFAASQFKEGPGTLVGQSRGTVTPGARECYPVADGPVAPPQIAIPLSQDHRLLRLAIGALTAAAFTYFMLWWMCGARS